MYICMWIVMSHCGSTVSTKLGPYHDCQLYTFGEEREREIVYGLH